MLLSVQHHAHAYQHLHSITHWAHAPILQERRIQELTAEVKEMHKEVDRLRNARTLTQVRVTCAGVQGVEGCWGT